MGFQSCRWLTQGKTFLTSDLPYQIFQRVKVKGRLIKQAMSSRQKDSGAQVEMFEVKVTERLNSLDLA
jgi:hypothetical protein